MNLEWEIRLEKFLLLLYVGRAEGKVVEPLKHDICIVDDDAAVSNSLAMLLETAGCRMTHYYSGVQFLNSDIRSVHGCILLDVRMPEKDGLTVLCEALKINPMLQIIMMSGHGDIPMAVKALRLCAKDFFEKPFQASVILAAMKRPVTALIRLTGINDLKIKNYTSPC